MNLRRIIIVLLVVFVTVLAGYRYMESDEAMDETGMLPEQVTIVPAVEQSVVMEHPDFIKAVYVPVIPEGINLALEGKLTANSFVQTFTVRKGNDGKTGGASYWEGEGDAYPNELLLELAQESQIHTVRLLLNPSEVWGARTQSFAVFASKTGESYQVLEVEKAYTFDPETGNEVVVEFSEREARFIKLIFTANSGANGAQVAELEVYGAYK